MKGVSILFSFMLAASTAVSVSGQTPHEAGMENHSETGGPREPVVMFWNLENFFDYIDQGTGTSDAEFSSRGARHWTKARFYAKCDAIAKMIMWVGDRYGSLPAVVGFAEVENAWVIRQLVSNTALMKYGYNLVHYESPDSRGIDVALIYCEDIYDLIDSKPCHIYEGVTSCAALMEDHGSTAGGEATCAGRVMKTRDILLVTLRDKASGEVTRFAVNHHPSKYGGEAVSRPKRLAAMTRLHDICDSLRTLNDGVNNFPMGENDDVHDTRPHNNVRIIAMGDFNDTPDNPLFGIFGDTMVNKAYPLYKKGYGTIKYQGKWELIDMFIISSEMDRIDADDAALKNNRGDRRGSKGIPEGKYRMEIVQAPFHTERDIAHVGEKPFRTYSGPRYIGGISDHFPILLLPEGN